jgi:hypothetical protein
MTKKIKRTIIAVFFSVLFIGSVFSDDTMTGHDMASKDRIGKLIHESVVDGYMLAYHFMDLRDQKENDKAAMDDSHDMATQEMDKPHHLMVYIMDKNHKPVLKGKVGFLIKGDDGKAQKEMGMYMSNGFGTTADMKKKGLYNITTKVVLGDQKLMDSFNHEMK